MEHIPILNNISTTHTEPLSLNKKTKISQIRAYLNIKTVFPRYGDSNVKDKMVNENVLSLI